MRLLPLMRELIFILHDKGVNSVLHSTYDVEVHLLEHSVWYILIPHSTTSRLLGYQTRAFLFLQPLFLPPVLILAVLCFFSNHSCHHRLKTVREKRPRWLLPLPPWACLRILEGIRLCVGPLWSASSTHSLSCYDSLCGRKVGRRLPQTTGWLWRACRPHTVW